MPGLDVTSAASKEAWIRAYAAFVEGANGVVRVVVGSTFRPSSLFVAVGLRLLLENPDVSALVAIDAEIPPGPDPKRKGRPIEVKL
jgi:hypothetical protein